MRFSNQFLPLFFIFLIFVPVRFFLSLYLRQKKHHFFRLTESMPGIFIDNVVVAYFRHQRLCHSPTNAQ